MPAYEIPPALPGDIYCVFPGCRAGGTGERRDKKVHKQEKNLLTEQSPGAMIPTEFLISAERSTVMLNLFAAFFFGYFYFYGFWTDKVKVLFAANNGVTTFA